MIDADIALGGQSLEGVFNVSEFFGCIKFFSSQYNNSPEIKKKKDIDKFIEFPSIPESKN